MDIIYQLPLPTEVCCKIFIFACISPHTGLGVAIIKKKLNVKKLKIPEKDKDVICIDKKVIRPKLKDIYIDLYFYTNFYNLTKIDLHESAGLYGNIANLYTLNNLTVIMLNETMVSGDIKDLKSLHNLITINLERTIVTGDIFHLRYLSNLQEIFLTDTGVFGNIAHLKSLKKLNTICIEHNPEANKDLDEDWNEIYVDSSVYGDISNLKSMNSLTHVWLTGTKVHGNINVMKSMYNLNVFKTSDSNVTGDYQEFYNYRANNGLPMCWV